MKIYIHSAKTLQTKPHTFTTISTAMSISYMPIQCNLLFFFSSKLHTTNLENCQHKCNKNWNVVALDRCKDRGFFQPHLTNLFKRIKKIWMTKKIVVDKKNTRVRVVALIVVYIRLLSVRIYHLDRRALKLYRNDIYLTTWFVYFILFFVYVIGLSKWLCSNRKNEQVDSTHYFSWLLFFFLFYIRTRAIEEIDGFLGMRTNRVWWAHSYLSGGNDNHHITALE